MTFDEALEEIAIHKSYADLPGWYAVSTPDESIIAYFADERRAAEYRLFLINQVVNGPNNKDET